MSKVTIEVGERFSDNGTTIGVKKPLEFELELDGRPHLTRYGKLETFAEGESGLRDKLRVLLPYMWRNYIFFEDNTNEMADFLKEHLEEIK